MVRWTVDFVDWVHRCSVYRSQFCLFLVSEYVKYIILPARYFESSILLTFQCLFAFISMELTFFVTCILALTVRFLTRRFIGEYDQTLGK